MSRKLLTFTTLMALGALALTTRAVAEDEPVPAEPTATCLIRITYDPTLLRVNANVLSDLVHSTSIERAAARKLLGPVFAERDDGRHDDLLTDLYDVELTMLSGVELAGDRGQPPGKGTALCRLQVQVRDLPEADRKAEGLLTEICRRLARAMQKVAQQDRQRLEEQVREAAQAHRRAAEQLKALRKQQQALFAAAGAQQLSRQDVVDRMQQLEDQIAALEMDLMADHAQQKAVSDQIAQIGHKISEPAQTDPVVAEWEKVASLREKAVAAIQDHRKAGVAGSSEVDAALEQLALARAALAEKRQAASLAAGGNLLADLNQQLVHLSIQVAKTGARLDTVQARLEEIQARNLLELANRYEYEIAPQERDLAEELYRAAKRLQEAQQQLESIWPPSVTILDGAEPDADNAPAD